MSRTLKLIIAASLLLNLLLAGLIVGNMCRSMMADRVHANIENAAASLPPEKRDHFLAVMRKAEKENKPYFRQLEDARTKASTLLKAESFNKKAFLAQVQEMEKIHGQLKLRLAKSIVEAAEDLNADERMLLAEFLRRPPPPRDAKPEPKN